MKLFIKIFLVSFILPSYISMYGYGEYVKDNYSNSFFITEPSNYFNQNAFSSIWDDTESLFSVQYNFKSTAINSAALHNSYLAALSYTFPIKKMNYCTIGFNPYTISDASFYSSQYSYLPVDEISSLTSPLAYNAIYENNGGISEMYINFSQKLSSKFSLGLKCSILFGNLEQNKRIRLYDLDYSFSDQDDILVDYTIKDSILINSTNEYKGYGFQLESKYELDKFDFFISGTYNFPLKVKSKFFFNQNIGDMQNLEQIQTYFQPNQEVTYNHDAFLKNIYIGARYKLNQTQSLLIKGECQKSFNYNSNSMYKTDPSIYSINLLFDSYSRILTISNLNYTNYKIGFFYRQMKNIGNVDYDYGLSVEYGARLINKNYFSIFLRMGNKSHNYIELDNEEYYLVGLRLENIEKWFLKGVKE